MIQCLYVLPIGVVFVSTESLVCITESSTESSCNNVFAELGPS